MTGTHIRSRLGKRLWLWLGVAGAVGLLVLAAGVGAWRRGRSVRDKPECVGQATPLPPERGCDSSADSRLIGSAEAPGGKGRLEGSGSSPLTSGATPELDGTQVSSDSASGDDADGTGLIDRFIRSSPDHARSLRQGEYHGTKIAMSISVRPGACRQQEVVYVGVRIVTKSPPEFGRQRRHSCGRGSGSKWGDWKTGTRS